MAADTSPTPLEVDCRSAWLSVKGSKSDALSSKEELKYALQCIGRNPTSKKIQRYWENHATGNKMGYQEFKLVVGKEHPTSIDDLMKAFRKLDVNNDGFITADELTRILTRRGEKMTEEEVHKIINEADENGDGKLDYSEFCQMMLSTAEASRSRCCEKSLESSWKPDSPDHEMRDTVQGPPVAMGNDDHLKESVQSPKSEEPLATGDVSLEGGQTGQRKLGSKSSVVSDNVGCRQSHLSSASTSRVARAQFRGDEELRQPLPPLKGKTEVTVTLTTSETAIDIPSQETPKETSEETPKEMSEETPKETTEETPKETSKETSEETPKEMTEETPKETSEETPKETSEETTKEASEETPKEASEETPKEMSEETTKEASEETPKEATEETPKEMSEETPKETSEETTKETSEETPKEMTEETPKEMSEETSEETPKEATEETPKEATEETPKETIEDNSTNTKNATETNASSGRGLSSASLPHLPVPSSLSPLVSHSMSSMTQVDRDKLDSLLLSDAKKTKGSKKSKSKKKKRKDNSGLSSQSEVQVSVSREKPLVKGSHSQSDLTTSTVPTVTNTHAQESPPTSLPESSLPLSPVNHPPPLTLPDDIKHWNTISAKGCFYLATEGSEENPVIKSHQYRLKFSQATALWLQMSQNDEVVVPVDVTLFVFKIDQDGDPSDVVALTQQKVEGKWSCRLELEKGSYALIPYSTGCWLKRSPSLEEEEGVEPVIREGSSLVLSEECKHALMEIYNRIDLDSSGGISRAEFDLFQECANDDVGDDDTWQVVKENFEMTEDEEITLQGFYTLHQMTANDSEGGVEELCDILTAMGYDASLKLRYACPFTLEIFSKECESELEIIDVLPCQEVVHPALCHLAMSEGVSGKVGGSNDALTCHAYILPHWISVVVQNKIPDDVSIKIDYSHSVNSYCNQNIPSSVHTTSVPGNSSQVVCHLMKELLEKEWVPHCILSMVKSN